MTVIPSMRELFAAAIAIFWLAKVGLTKRPPPLITTLVPFELPRKVDPCGSRIGKLSPVASL